MVSKVFVLLFISIVFAQETPKVLVILDDATKSSEYKKFIGQIEGNGFKAEVKSKNDFIDLFNYEENAYSSVVLMAPSFSFRKVSVRDFVKFIDQGGNMIIAMNETYNKKYQELLYSLDMEVDERKSVVIDEKHKVTIQQDNKTHNFVFSNSFIESKVLFTSKLQNVLYEGVGLHIPQSPLTASLLVAQKTASTSLYPEIKFAQQDKITLVSSLQARNNARVIVTGSVTMFSDFAFDSVINHPLANNMKSDNEAFSKIIVQWALQKKGVIEYRNFQWKKVGGVPDVDYDDQVVINDTLKVTFDMYELVNNKYVPYISDDVQIIFKLIDPVIIKYCKNMKNGSYEVTFQTPDVFGVYTLIFNYRRPFLTYLEHKETIPLRTFRLTQVDRFVTSAYPFYAACASMLIGFVIFSLFYLNHVDKKEEEVKTD